MHGTSLGVGTDIERIDRFRMLDPVDHRRFLARVYTRRELAYCFSTANPARHLALRFTAKEAVVKALGHLGLGGVSYRTVEILADAHGAPDVALGAKRLAGVSARVSWTCAGAQAMATAVAVRAA